MTLKPIAPEPEHKCADCEGSLTKELILLVWEAFESGYIPLQKVHWYERARKALSKAGVN